jgi:hypothetical protein
VLTNTDPRSIDLLVKSVGNRGNATDYSSGRVKSRPPFVVND